MPLNGRDLVLAAHKRTVVNRPPWVPFTGVHAAALAGYRADEYLLDPAKIVAGIETAYSLYRPDGLPVCFDLQIEAEILGAALHWAEDAPPSVISHPLVDGYAALADLRVPTASDGRIPIVLQATRALKKTVGKQAALYGLVTGPFTLAAHLRGVNIFLDMFDAPEDLQRLMAFCGLVARAMADYYSAAGADVIAVVDPMISQISPDHFHEFVHKEAGATFEHIRASNCASSFFVCGNATALLASMAACRPDGIAVDENVDMALLAAVAAEYNISFAGNIPLTTVMLFGSEAQNMAAVLNLVDAHAGPGYILSPGCDIPFSVPVSNIGALTLAVHEPEKARAILANQTAGNTVELDIQLPEYTNLQRPLVELITLDSDTCPPCKYMVDATRRVAEMVPGGIDWVEYKITSPENVVRMKKLGVSNLPTIVINGQVAFVSRIPDLASYQKAIARVAAESASVSAAVGRKEGA